MIIDEKRIIRKERLALRVLLELLRIIFIVVILGAVGWTIIGNIYTVNETTESYSWLGAIAILILLFVLYRKKWQFSGWHKKGSLKLPKSVTATLIVSSILLIISPFVMAALSS